MEASDFRKLCGETWDWIEAGPEGSVLGRAPDPDDRGELEGQPGPERPARDLVQVEARESAPGLTAMWTLAGKTATSRTISHQRASLRVEGGMTARPPAISAQPEWKTAAFGLIGT